MLLAGRGGFIVELPNGTISTAGHHQVLTGGSIRFTINATTDSLMPHTLHIQMMYLKTYMNAGVVALYVCGKYGKSIAWKSIKRLKIVVVYNVVREIDALWHDHMSIPEWSESSLVIPECKKNNISHPTIEFVHKIGTHYSNRAQHKFKILNIKVCTFE